MRWGLKEAEAKIRADGQELDLRPTASDERATDADVSIKDAGGKSGGRVSTYHEVDQRALPGQISFTPDGKAIAYLVRERGVDNLCQPLDGRPYRQMTHFTKDQILRFVFSPDGTRLGLERGAEESDAVLFHDITK